MTTDVHTESADSRRSPLTKDRVLRTAVALADKAGIEALTAVSRRRRSPRTRSR
jgi:hypothetical protein